MKSIYIILALFLSSFMCTNNLEAQNIFVDSSSTCTSCSGLSWSQAYQSLQNALGVATSGDTIFVAQGTYFPDNGLGIPNNKRDTSFVITSGITVLGGYPSGGGTRDWQTNTTTLSGEIQQDGDSTNNSVNVVYTENVSAQTVVNGFIIREGYAIVVLPEIFGNSGGAWYNMGEGAGNSSNPHVINCHFYKNFALSGGALFNNGRDGGSANATIENCIFEANFAEYYAGAIHNDAMYGESSPVIIGSTFINNQSAGKCAGIYNRGSHTGMSNPIITHCEFYNNISDDDAGAIWNDGTNNGTCNPQIINCTFANNEAWGKGAAVYSDGNLGECHPTFINCSIGENDGFSSGGSVFNHGYSGTSAPSFINCIIWGTGYNILYNQGATPTFNNCNIKTSGGSSSWNTLYGIDGGNNHEFDPLFVDADNNDLRLHICSKAIDAGSNDSIPATLLTDIDNNSRIFNAATIDIGAYEFQGAPSFITVDSITVINAIECSTPFGQAEVHFTSPGGFPDFLWDNMENTVIADSLSHGIHKAIVSNTISGCSDSTTILIEIGTLESVIYVDSAANGLNTGCNWADAFVSLQDALLNAQSGDSILIAGGTYFPDEYMSDDFNDRFLSFQIPDSVVVLGGYPSGGGQRNWTLNKTILDGDIQQDGDSSYNTYQIVKTLNVSSQTIIDGLIIRNGNANANSSTEYYGGAWYNDGSNAGNNSSPIIRNCLFTNNYGKYGGAFFTRGRYSGNSSPTLINCIFIGNAAYLGGAVYNDGRSSGICDAQYINCTFTQNTASYKANPIYNDARYAGSSTSTFANCIIWDNDDNLIYNNEASPEYINSIVAASGGSANWNPDFGVSLSGNIDKDPHFVDVSNHNLNLDACSYAIDAGLNSAIPALMLSDFDGNARRYNNGTIDIGALEYQGIGSYLKIDSINVLQNSSCGLPVGQAEVFFSAAVTNINILWDNGETTSIASSLNFGAHQCWITSPNSSCVDSALTIIDMEMSNTVIYVDSAAIGTNTGCSWTDAFNSLQDAILNSDAGDSILVAKGTYYPDVYNGLDHNDRFRSFNIPDSVTVLGGFPNGGGTRNSMINKTVMCGEIQQDNDSTNNTYHVVKTEFVSPVTHVDGFTIRYGSSNANSEYDGAGWHNNGSGVNNSSSPTISNCTFYKNKAYNGGAFYSTANDTGYCAPLIVNCIFINNSAEQKGSAMYNKAYYDGSNQPKIVNCTFVGNRTIAYNTVNDNGVINNSHCDTFTISNSIFWGNKEPILDNYETTTIIENCLIQGGVILGQWNPYDGIDGGGNICIDPLFTNPENGDYSLSACSKAINAGMNSSLPPTYTHDYAVNPRIYEGSIDIGAFEYQHTLNHSYIDSTSVLQSATCSGSGQAQVFYSASNGSSSVIWDSGESTDIATTLSGSQMVWVTNSLSACKDSALVFVPVTNTTGVIYVDASANGTNTGCSWTNAFNNLSDACLNATYGDSLFVAAGTYYPDNFSDLDMNIRTNTFLIPDGVAVMAGYPSGGGIRDWRVNKTILSGEIQQDNDTSNNAYNVVNFKNASDATLLDGFAIVSGNASAFNQFEKGGAIYNNGSDSLNISSPKIINCQFKKNHATLGGAIYNNGGDYGTCDPQILDCKFIGNSARSASAVYNNARKGSCSPTFINNLFVDNYARYSGTMFNYALKNGTSNPTLTNCTFAKNSNNFNYGVLYNYTDTGSCVPVLSNCIFWNTSSQTSQEINNGGTANPVVTNCIVQNSSGAGTFNFDPNFVNSDSLDFHLQEGSPAINAGTSSLGNLPLNDLDGHTRIYGFDVDLGCYEFIPNQSQILQEVNTVICEGDSLWVGPFWHTTTGIYTDSIISSIGGDSIVITTLVVHPIPAIYFGPDQSVAGDSVIILNASPGLISYNWSTGSTYQITNIDSTNITDGNVAIIWCEVTDHHACVNSDTIAITFNILNAMAQLPAQFDLSAYPNPSSGKVFLKSSVTIQKLEVYSIKGQLILSKAINEISAEINLGAEAEGLYFIKIQTAKGTVIKKINKI